MKRLIVFVALLAVASATWLLIRDRKHESGSYRFVPIERGTVESFVSSTGTLRATSTVQVGTQVSGQVEEILADFNDEVKQGQLIARIDPTLLEQEVRSARTAVDRAEAEVDQAVREMARAERLYAESAVTETAYTTAQYQLALARASREAARINLDKAHPSGQEWFWLGVVFPEGSEPA